MNLCFFELHPVNSYSPNNQSRTPGDNLSESKPVKTSGSLSNSNEKDKKAICFLLGKKNTTTLHVHHAFLYISLPSLHNYDVKLTGTHDNDFLFLFVNLGAVLYNSPPEENRKHLTNEKSCNNSNEVWSSVTSLFGWRFRFRCRQLCLSSLLETFRLEEDIFSRILILKK